MKNKIRFCALALVGAATLTVSAYTEPQPEVKGVTVGGYLGSRIEACIAGRVMNQDVDELVAPFRTKTETSLWQTEFWGKWTQGAIGLYRYNRDKALFEKIKAGVASLIATQQKNGYIGNYKPEAQLGGWDVWGRKYVALALVDWYDLTGDKKALKAAQMEIDYTMTQLGPGKGDIVKSGNYVGMASSSILEPVVYIYKRTNEKKYLDFAEWIVAQWETPDGPKLLSKADVPVALRTPYTEVWYGEKNGRKAYEMMSCYEGLLELYKVTGKAEYLDVVKKVVNHIIAEEITIGGSGASQECWYGGKTMQTYATLLPQETCVTFTWLQLCNRLLRLTEDPKYADCIEQTIYNALLGSMKADGSQIVKYTPLEGYREEGEHQCGIHINCCNANGPRAYALIPMYAYIAKANGIDVNLYGQGSATVKVGKNTVSLTQQSTYPESGDVKVLVNPEKSEKFVLKLRIPAWSARTVVKVNGEAVDGVSAGNYLAIDRTWQKGDVVTLGFDMRGRVHKLNHCLAVTRGPVVLARDSRFGDGFVDESLRLVEKDGYVELTENKDKGFAWQSFFVKVYKGLYNEFNHEGQIKMCDYGSAGNTWDKAQRYRVWLPEVNDPKLK